MEENQIGKVTQIWPKRAMRDIKDAEEFLELLRSRKKDLITDLNKSVFDVFLHWERVPRSDRNFLYKKMDQIIRELKNLNRRSATIKTLQEDLAKDITEKGEM
jgi:hypothetical protein